MPEHIQNDEHIARRKSDRADDQTIELLDDALQRQSLNGPTYPRKRPKSLLDLPLVLVREILLDLVQCYTTPEHRTIQLFSLLNIRRVHRFFDAEITWLLGRDFERWDKVNRKACLYKAPTPFVIQILQGCISDHDRGGCEFATQMHSVIDILEDQFNQLGASKEREKLLHAVCHTFATRPWQREIFRWRTPDRNTYYPWEKMPKCWNPIPTAFLVALHARYDNVIQNMLETIDTIPCDDRYAKKRRLAAAESYDLGLPLDLAIFSGQPGQVELLWAHGARMSQKWSNVDAFVCTALEFAAQRGHDQVLELVIPRLFPNKLRTQKSLHIVGKVLRMAARHQRWHIVRPLVKEYSQLFIDANMQDYLSSTLCILARHGADDVVSALLDWVESPTTCFPLRDAAGGGHLSTCKLLLWEGPRPEQQTILQQSEEFARAVARGGSIDICKLLRPHFFWRECHEIHFLPIAAELGNLEFAKYAVENRCDRNAPQKHRESIIPDLDRPVYYPEDIRYFALLRAIVSGHEDIVIWMINELGLDIGPDAEIMYPELDPWHLAIHAKTSAKLRLALGCSDELDVCDCKEGPTKCKKDAIETLDMYQKALRLRKDYSRDWCKRRASEV